MQLFDYGQTDQAADGAPPPDLSEADWTVLQGFAAQRLYAAGSAIIAAGAPDAALYLIAGGRVAVTAANATLELGPYAAFNLCAFLDGGANAAGAAALEASSLLVLTREQFDRLAAWQPLAALALLKLLAAASSRRLRQGAAPV